ncbi:MAG: ABC transporter permease subunit [Oscillibacter sp.]|nr:ABC transporter permease subunit [Oscillibacter sp.]
MSKNMKKMLTGYGLVLPSFLMVMLVVTWPILTAMKTSFTDPDTGGFTLDNYKYFFETPRELTNILFTLFVVVVTVALAIIIAYMLALYLRFVRSKISRWIGNLYLLPRFVPGMVAVYAMITVIRDSGLLNRISQLFGGDFKPGMMYQASGMITMNLWFNIPFAALMITAGLGAIPDSMIESARDVGASKLRVFRSMILPLSIKDVVIAATFVFMSNVGSFTTPYLMGGNYPKMLGIVLFDQFNKYLRYERAAAMSFIIFLICSVSAGVYIYTNLREKEWEKN